MSGKESNKSQQPDCGDLIGGRHKTYSADAQKNQIYAGAISGFLTRSLTQPLDVLKIRFQLQVEPVSSSLLKGAADAAPHSQSKYTSFFQACRVIYREEGLPAFWKGHNSGQVMSVLFSVIQFWSYEQFSLGIRQMEWLGHHTHLCDFVAGSMAGCLSTFFTTPFDVIRTRVVAQDPGTGYRSIAHAIPVIVRMEGVRGLFRGLTTATIQIGPLIGGNFMFYNSFNDIAKQVLEPPNDHLPAWCCFITGTAAGVASKSALYPLDFIKKRQQIQGFEEFRKTFGRNQRCTTIMSCVRLTLREEGMLGFYKGMYPTLIKSGLTTALYFSIYDKFKEILMGKC